MELGLNDFLAELGNSTVSRLQRENKSREIPGVKPVKEEVAIKIPTQQVQRKNKPEPIQEDYEEEENYEEEDTSEDYTEQSDVLEEDFVETALDYASVIMKTVRESFDSKLQKKKVFESIRSAINLYLDDPVQQSTRQNIQQSPSLFSSQEKITESEFNSMPTVQQGSIPGTIKMNNLAGQSVNINQEPKGIMESKLNIGVKVGSDGKKHADLSNMNETDVYSLRVLSGIEEEKK